MPFCGSCGAKVPENARFCSSCGARVERLENAPAVPEDEDFPDFLLTTTESGVREIASESGIWKALEEASENEDECVRLIPAKKGGVTMLGYCFHPEDQRYSVQLIWNERKNRYDACRERGGFSLDQAAELFLRYARSRQLPADWEEWSEL